jgi:hypothetical protein
MAEHDYALANADGATFRADLNNALSAVVGQNSKATAPSTTFAYMRWYDTTDNLIKERNAGDSAWITLGKYDQTNGKIIWYDFTGADIASASTTDLSGATGKTVTVTGTVTIAGLGTVDAGLIYNLHFSDTGTITHNGSSNILPGGVDITRAAGHTAQVLSLGSGNWRWLNYQRGDGSVGKHSLWIPSRGMEPAETNGCGAWTKSETTAGRPDVHGMPFDGGTDEHAQFSVALGSSYNGSTISFIPVWAGLDAAATYGTDTVSWALQALATIDDATIDAAFGTAVNVTETTPNTVEDIKYGSESSAITISGAADSALTWFDIYRDVSADSMSEDATLIGIILFVTTNEAVDS